MAGAGANDGDAGPGPGGLNFDELVDAQVSQYDTSILLLEHYHQSLGQIIQGYKVEMESIKSSQDPKTPVDFVIAKSINKRLLVEIGCEINIVSNAFNHLINGNELTIDPDDVMAKIFEHPLASAANSIIIENVRGNGTSGSGDGPTQEEESGDEEPGAGADQEDLAEGYGDMDLASTETEIIDCQFDDPTEQPKTEPVPAALDMSDDDDDQVGCTISFSSGRRFQDQGQDVGQKTIITILNGKKVASSTEAKPGPSTSASGAGPSTAAVAATSTSGRSSGIQAAGNYFRSTASATASDTAQIENHVSSSRPRPAPAATTATSNATAQTNSVTSSGIGINGENVITLGDESSDDEDDGIEIIRVTTPYDKLAEVAATILNAIELNNTVQHSSVTTSMLAMRAKTFFEKLVALNIGMDRKERTQGGITEVEKFQYGTAINGIIGHLRGIFGRSYDIDVILRLYGPVPRIFYNYYSHNN